MHVTSYNNTINEDIFALYNVDIMAILEPNAKTICVEGLCLRLHNGYKYLCSLHMLYADRKVSSACDLSGGRSADPGLSHVEAALRGDYKQLQNNTVQKHERESGIHNTCMTVFTGVWPLFYPAWSYILSCTLDTYREWK